MKKEASVETPEGLYPKPWIKRLNGGTWPKNANTHKRMASQWSLSAGLQLPTKAKSGMERTAFSCAAC